MFSPDLCFEILCCMVCCAEWHGPAVGLGEDEHVSEDAWSSNYGVRSK